LNTVRPGNDDQVAPLLALHGIDRSLAAQLQAAGERLLDLTRNEGVEFGLTLDIGTGHPVAAILRGSGSDLDFEAHRRLLRSNRRYVALHTHPSSTPPSHRDFLVLLSNPSVQTLIVIGADATWYIVSRDPAMKLPDEQWARATFAAAFVELRPHYASRVQAGEMTASEALTALLDAVWRVVAPRLGLRYDRLEKVTS
jgi:hypothetical protein